MKFEKEKLKFVELVGDSKILEKLLSRDARNPNLMIRYLREGAEELPGAHPPVNIEVLTQTAEQPVPSTSQTVPRETILEASEDAEIDPDDQVDPLNTSDSVLAGR